MTGLILSIGVPLAVVIYVLMQPEKAHLIASWIWGGLARIWRRADRKAVAYKVQGEINSARADLLRDSPAEVIEGKLKIKWNDADAAEAVIRDGEVVVFMGRFKRHEQNIAHAVMAYLPRAVVPRARRYIAPETIRAADLTLAKTILASAAASPGALDVFFEEHLDPACRDVDLKRRVIEMDDIDLHGWLLRILLPEFRQLGNELHPGEPDSRCANETETFTGWLHQLATREPGDDSTPLGFNGSFIRVAFVLVAQKNKLLDKGTEPYRKQVKRLIYSGDYDAIYVLGRDDNISAVDEIVGQLGADGRLAFKSSHTYRLRSDFQRKRKLSRDRATIACFRPRTRPEDEVNLGDEAPTIPVETFFPDDEIRITRTTQETPSSASSESGKLAG